VKRGKSAARGEPINAWLGREIRLEGGELHFDGCLRLDGEVLAGSLSGPSLVVGEGARVSGRLEVRRLTVYGQVEAEARVSEEVWVAPDGALHGDLTLGTSRVTIEDGATLEARVHVQQAAAAGSLGPREGET
jgi:cytoskeletal protein CcmA (bactofilin family)